MSSRKLSADNVTAILNKIGVSAADMQLVTSLVKFEPGEIVITPHARHTLELAGTNPSIYLLRHVCGDWGILGPNEMSRQ